MANSLNFFGLESALNSEDFESLTVQGEASTLPQIVIESAHSDELRTQFRISAKNIKQQKIVDSAGILDALENYFERGYSTVICRTAKEHIIYSRTPKGVRIRSEPISQTSDSAGFKSNVKTFIQTPEIRKMLIELNILDKNGAIRREQYNKLIQIKNFVGIVHEILPEIQESKPINIVDGACGKSYLSFILYYFLRDHWNLEAKFQCIDRNTDLLDRCRRIQDSLGYEHMDFLDGAVEKFTTDRKVDLFFSLHGCDTATDESIAAGVRLNSKVIVVVPCCHFEIRSQLRQHPLKSLTKFGLFEERFASLLTDGLRALALEIAGYDVSVFRFVTDDVSPKNILLRAIKRGTRIDPQAIVRYKELREMFGVSPAIEKLILDWSKEPRCE